MSTDGGASWRRAELGHEKRGWTRWELPWKPKPGSHQLLARATDKAGNTQPDTVPFNEGGYLFWAVVRHPVTAVR